MTRDEFLNTLYNKGLEDEDIMNELVTEIDSIKLDEAVEIEQQPINAQVDYILSKTPTDQHQLLVNNIVQWSSKTIEIEEEGNGFERGNPQQLHA